LNYRRFDSRLTLLNLAPDVTVRRMTCCRYRLLLS